MAQSELYSSDFDLPLFALIRYGHRHIIICLWVRVIVASITRDVINLFDHMI